jgi:hypothetical protein
MANRRASSLSELGPLNTPGEAVVSTKYLRERSASILGASGLAHRVGAPGLVSRTMSIEYNIDIRPMTRKRHKRCF